MTLGIAGSGPYGRIRHLQEEINACKYELGLIAEGMRRSLGSKRLKEIILADRAEIRTIKANQKAMRK